MLTFDSVAAQLSDKFIENLIDFYVVDFEKVAQARKVSGKFYFLGKISLPFKQPKSPCFL